MAKYDYPRETVEPVYFDEILVNGAMATLPMDYSLTRGLDRPLVWAPVQVINDKFAFVKTEVLEPGWHQVWVRKGTTVIAAGRIRVT